MTEIDYEAVASNLDRAADLMWMYGRCIDGNGSDTQGRMCILGALAEAKGVEKKSWTSLQEANWNSQLGSVEALALDWFIASRPELADFQPQWKYGMNDGFNSVYFNDSLTVNPENDALVIDTMRRTAKAVRALGTNG